MFINLETKLLEKRSSFVVSLRRRPTEGGGDSESARRSADFHGGSGAFLDISNYRARRDEAGGWTDGWSIPDDGWPDLA
jgi:hypothetical protein